MHLLYSLFSLLSAILTSLIYYILHVSVICECCTCWCITKSSWPHDAMGKGLVSVLYNIHVWWDIVILSCSLYIFLTQHSLSHIIIHLFIYLNLFYTNTHIYLATMSFTLYTLLYSLHKNSLLTSSAFSSKAPRILNSSFRSLEFQLVMPLFSQFHW